MLLSHALSLVLLPLAAARPYPESAAPAARGALGERMLLSSAAAEAQFNFQPWEFRNICLECNRNQTTEQYACKTKFDWYDPNSVPENNVTSGSCLSDAWTWDGAAVSAGGKVSYPSENKACFYQSTLNYLSFNLAKFESEKNFTLSVVHRYKDDQNFTAPYDHPSIFTFPNFQLPVVKNTSLSLVSFSKAVQYAKVQGVSD